MKLYLFERGGGKTVTAFGSEGFTMAGIVREAEDTHIGCMYLEKGGIVGGHPAPVPQLLLVMAGEAVVRSDGGEPQTIGPGTAAYWESGEWHETRTETGLTAIVIESANMNVRMTEVAAG